MTEWTPIDTAPDDSSSGAHTVRFADQIWSLHIDDRGAWAQLANVGRPLPLRGVNTFHGLFAEPEWAAGGTSHLAAAAPMLYLARGIAPLGIEDMTTGTYEITWFDLTRLRVAAMAPRDIDGGDESFVPPSGAPGPVALLLRRTSR